jgi:hypothetical protein
VNQIGQQALKLVLTLLVVALLLQWTWQLVKPLVPLGVMIGVVWVVVRVVRARRQDW